MALPRVAGGHRHRVGEGRVGAARGAAAGEPLVEDEDPVVGEEEVERGAGLGVHREHRRGGQPQVAVRVLDVGADQLIYSPLTMTMDQKHVLRCIETFGKHVLPQFDKDPVHSTTRMREAALKQAAA